MLCLVLNRQSFSLFWLCWFRQVLVPRIAWYCDFRSILGPQLQLNTLSLSSLQPYLLYRAFPVPNTQLNELWVYLIWIRLNHTCILLAIFSGLPVRLACCGWGQQLETTSWLTRFTVLWSWNCATSVEFHVGLAICSGILQAHQEYCSFVAAEATTM